MPSGWGVAWSSSLRTRQATNPVPPMPRVEAICDPQAERRSILELATLSTLSTVWSDRAPKQIADRVAEALLPMLAADIVHVSLPGSGGEMRIEITRSGPPVTDRALAALRAAMRRVWQGSSPRAASVFAEAGGPRTMR